MKTATPSIKLFLDRTLARYHQRDFLSSDPLEFVHQVSRPHAREATALISALFAYGNVTQIRKSVTLALELTAGKAADSNGQALENAVRGLAADLADSTARRLTLERFAPFYHRFNTSEDLVILLALISRSWAKYGSVGNHFVSRLKPEAEDFSDALNAFLDDWLRWASELPVKSASFRYLVTRPADGSCCKRWCMFLRWMGRKDELDPGLWQAGSPLISRGGLHSRQLVMPLDTHTGRISQYVGLTERKTLQWRAAREITARLRELDPEDPTKYDFALSRLGILDFCQKKFREEICLACDLVSVCRFAKKNLKKGKPRKS